MNTIDRKKRNIYYHIRFVLMRIWYLEESWRQDLPTLDDLLKLNFDQLEQLAKDLLHQKEFSPTTSGCGKELYVSLKHLGHEDVPRERRRSK